jgi:hypothetical protein
MFGMIDAALPPSVSEPSNPRSSRQIGVAMVARANGADNCTSSTSTPD